MSDSKIRLSFYKDIAEMIGLYAKWGTLAVGGLCLLVYSNEIDHFPEGINLGEGLAFYLVSAGFLIAYTMFALIVTAMGAVVMGLPTVLFQRFRHRRLSVQRTHLESQLKADFSPMWTGPVLGMGSLGLLIWLLYSLGHPIEGAKFLPVPFMQGLLVAFSLGVQRRLRVLDVGLVMNGNDDAERNRRRNASRMAQNVLLVGIIFCPMLLAPNRTFLVDAGFRIAQLRKDNATIHVKKPWAERVSRSTLTPRKSFLGEDYQEFENVNVLLRSVGTKVVVALPKIGDKLAAPLSIPADYIVVE